MADIDSLLTTESNRIGPDIHRRILNTSHWIKLVNKDTWPDEMGSTINALTYDRTLPTSTPSWSTVSFNTGTGNSCVPTAYEVTLPQTLRTYNLQQMSLVSPPICVNDLRFSFQRKQQLSAALDQLTQNTRWAWQQRHRSEYIRLGEHKVVATAAFDEDPDAFPTGGAATSTLTMGMLGRYYIEMIREGGEVGAAAYNDGQPIFVCSLGHELYHNLLREAAGFRTDIRESSKADSLLAPLGMTHSYLGWTFSVDPFPPRYNLSGGAWVEVPPFTTEATTKGDRQILNPDYRTATHEDVVLFHPQVMTSLVPKPISAPGGMTNFDPTKYNGDWFFINERDIDTNPLRNWGKFYGHFSSGSMPVHPELGFTLRVLRCDVMDQSAACA